MMGCQEHCSQGALARKMGSAFSALQGASQPRINQHVLVTREFIHQHRASRLAGAK
jgi:hypothetical protein